MITTRRFFLSGLAAALAAPAIVKFQNIMPVKNVPLAIVLPKELLHATRILDLSQGENISRIIIAEKFADWTYAIDGKPATSAEYQQILQNNNYFPNNEGLYRPVEVTRILRT